MAKNKKAKQQAQRAAKRKSDRIRGMIGAVVALAFVALVIYFTMERVTGRNTFPAEAVPDPVLGVAAASAGVDEADIIEIVEYGDFGCSACRGWHQSGVREQILADFGDRVRFVWRDFPVITDLSPKAAEAGHCASAQGRFWEFHDHLYENYVGLDPLHLQSYATEAGIDVAAFDICMDEENMLSKVRANDLEARNLGIRGTPGFVINGQVLLGPPSYEMLASIIQNAN